MGGTAYARPRHVGALANRAFSDREAAPALACSMRDRSRELFPVACGWELARAGA